MTPTHAATFPFFHPSSPFARSISNLSNGVLLAMLGILVLIVFLVLYAGIRFKAQPGQPDPKPSYGNFKLELVYTIGPALMLAAIMAFTIRTMRASDPPSKDPDSIEVIGHQWWWEVRYLKTGIVTANEVHIPIHTPERLGLDSADVIHDWWVPELGRKMDMIPGVHNQTWFAADKPGVYYGQCAEYCGKEHAWMRIRVIAQKPADYAAWMQKEETPPPIPTQADTIQGAQDFKEMSCSSCHTIEGTGATARIGPDLTHVAGRQTLAAGRIENTPANLDAWLLDPDKLKPGSRMPNLHLTTEQRKDLVAYLETMR